jgi:hypothetical protein
VPAEPAGRRVLRIGFGLLWLFDGILQAQPRLPSGLVPGVIEPAAGGSPSWLHRLVDWAGAGWNHVPVPADIAVVLIEAGIGIWLLAASRGRASRLAGLASVGLGLVVWVLGESFGEIFSPGLTWLTGAPGAAVLYLAAGALIALPVGAWRSARLGRLTLAALGLLLAGMAVLQAWPGRGFWHGVEHGRMGNLPVSALSMAQMPQPGFLAGWVSAFARFDQAHGFAVNLAVVAFLAVTGAAFLSGRPWLIRPVLGVFIVVCLDVWVLVQDLAFLGGLGTDPGSMIPYILLAAGGYLALTRGAQPRNPAIARQVSSGASSRPKCPARS